MQVIGHNAYRYDDVFLVPLLERVFADDLQLGGAANNIKFMRTRFLEFRDSFALLTGSLKRLGQEFAVPHQKLDVDATSFAAADFDDPAKCAKIREYCERDVLCLSEVYGSVFELMRSIVAE